MMAGLPPIVLGFIFLILGALLAFWITSKSRGLSRTGPVQNPFLLMFGTGLWIGLMLGGLGMIFHAFFATGMATALILVSAWFLNRRRRQGK